MPNAQMKSDVEDDASDGEGIDDYLGDEWDESNYISLDFKEDDFSGDGNRVETQEVSDSLQPSWDAINDLYNNNKLNEEEALRLKSKCKILYESLLIQKRSEQKRLEEARKFVSIIERQKSQLNGYRVDDESSDKPEDRSEMMRIREKMMRCSNELLISQCRQEDLQASLEILMEEEKILRFEVSKLQNSGNKDKQMESRLQNIEDLDKEVTSKEVECKLLRENVDSCKERNVNKSKEVEVLKETLRQLQEKLDTLGPQIFKVVKQSDRLKLKKTNEAAKLKELSDEAKRNHRKLHDLTNELFELEKEKFNLSELLEERRVEVNRNEEALRSLTVDCEFSKNREKDLNLERTQLDLSLKQSMTLKKQLQERSSKLLRQFNAELKHLRKMKMVLETVRTSHEQAVLEHQKVSDLKRSISMSKNEDELKELLKDIKKKKENLESQKDLESLESQQIKELLTNQEKYFVELINNKKEIQALNQIVASKTTEKNNRAKDLLKTKQQLREAQLEVKLKLSEIEEQKSELNKINSRHRHINELYNLLRGERNKLSKLFIIGGQNVLELQGRVKLQNNEVEVLQSASLGKENLLQKQHLAYLASTLAAEKLRSEISSINMQLINLNESHGKTFGSLNFANKSLEECQREIVRIKEVQKSEQLQREQRISRLQDKKMEIEKQDEKHRVLESISRKGEVALSFKEEEVKILRTRLDDFKRITNILKEKLKNKRKVEDDLVNIQIQMSQYQEVLIELENKFINSKCDGRIRFLEGSELNEDDLNDKLNNLAVRFLKKTKEVKEKEVVYQRIFNCTKHAWENIKIGKTESLALAKEGSYLRTRVARATLKVMSLVAELSMRKAEMMHLERTIEDKKAELLAMEQNLEKGLPPSEDIERDVERECRRLEKLQLRYSTQESEIDRNHHHHH